MRECAACGGVVATSYRYCPWCASPQRLKLVDFFRGRDHKALRVSRYLGDDPQVRFSVWDDELVAEAAVSLEEAEAQRLAHFVLGTQPRVRRASLLEQLGLR